VAACLYSAGAGPARSGSIRTLQRGSVWERYAGQSGRSPFLGQGRFWNHVWQVAEASRSALSISVPK
jgi:hypothetical protein